MTAIADAQAALAANTAAVTALTNAVNGFDGNTDDAAVEAISQALTTNTAQINAAVASLGGGAAASTPPSPLS